VAVAANPAPAGLAVTGPATARGPAASGTTALTGAATVTTLTVTGLARAIGVPPVADPPAATFRATGTASRAPGSCLAAVPASLARPAPLAQAAHRTATGLPAAITP